MVGSSVMCVSVAHCFNSYGLIYDHTPQLVVRSTDVHDPPIYLHTYGTHVVCMALEIIIIIIEIPVSLKIYDIFVMINLFPGTLN